MRRFILAPLKYIAFGMFWALFIMWLFTVTVKSDEPVDKPDMGITVTTLQDAPVASNLPVEVDVN